MVSPDPSPGGIPPATASPASMPPPPLPAAVANANSLWPASVVLALLVLLVFALISVRLALAHLGDLFTSIFAGLCVVGTLLLLFSPRKRDTYWVAVAALSCLTYRSLNVAIVHFDQPAQIIPGVPALVNQIIPVLTALLVLLLFWRFTLGRPSRKFHRFSVRPTGKITPPPAAS